MNDTTPTKADPDELLSYKDVARLLCCSVRTAWSLAASGAIPRVRLGPRLVRFRRQDILAYVDRQARIEARR